MSNTQTDRIAGLIFLLLGLWFTLQASQFEATGLGDPLGPSVFPLILGILLMICSVWLIIKPDPNPIWPEARAWGLMTLIIICLVIYAYLLKSVGFILATTFEMISLGLIFQGPPLKTVLYSVLLAIFLYLLFDTALGLNLPNGILPF